MEAENLDAKSKLKFLLLNIYVEQEVVQGLFIACDRLFVVEISFMSLLLDRMTCNFKWSLSDLVVYSKID